MKIVLEKEVIQKVLEDYIVNVVDIKYSILSTDFDSLHNKFTIEFDLNFEKDKH